MGATALAGMDERVKSNVPATCRASLSLWADRFQIDVTTKFDTLWSMRTIKDVALDRQRLPRVRRQPRNHGLQPLGENSWPDRRARTIRS